MVANRDTKREGLINQIFSAFKGVRLGNGVGLTEAQAIDCYASPDERKEYRSHDETENWIEIPVRSLYRYWDSVSFFDAAGMRFHLPVFLLLALEYFEEEVEKMYNEGPVRGTVPDIEFHLTSVLKYLDDGSEDGIKMREFDAERFSLLNAEQMGCVIRFLEFRTCELGKEDNQRILLERAITHWTSKLNSVL